MLVRFFNIVLFISIATNIAGAVHKKDSANFEKVANILSAHFRDLPSSRKPVTENSKEPLFCNKTVNKKRKKLSSPRQKTYAILSEEEQLKKKIKKAMFLEDFSHDNNIEKDRAYVEKNRAYAEELAKSMEQDMTVDPIKFRTTVYYDHDKQKIVRSVRNRW